MQVSIIIVNYNTKELIKNCINSIYKYTQDIQYEIIVSDNGSTEVLKLELWKSVYYEWNLQYFFYDIIIYHAYFIYHRMFQI